MTYQLVYADDNSNVAETASNTGIGFINSDSPSIELNQMKYLTTERDSFGDDFFYLEFKTTSTRDSSELSSVFDF